MSVRSSILSNIGMTLRTMAEFANSSVVTGKAEAVDLEASALPVAFILQGPENKVSGSTEMEAWEWTVVLEVWCKDTSVETLYAAIHQALAVDVTRGGYALNFYRDGGDVLSLDPARSLSALQQTYKIIYRHPLGTP